MADSSSKSPAEATARTQAERSATSDKALLDAAIDLILERGIEKTTLQAIGARAGYSRGLATYRFGSKAGLFDAICKSISHRWIAYLTRGVADKNGIDAMCAAIDAYVSFVSDAPRDTRVLHILLCAAAAPQSNFQETAKHVYERQREDVVAWVRQGIAEGSIRSDIDPRSESAKFVAFLSGITYLWLLDPAVIDFRKANEDFKAQLRIALAA